MRASAPAGPSAPMRRSPSAKVSPCSSGATAKSATASASSPWSIDQSNDAMASRCDQPAQARPSDGADGEQRAQAA